MTPTPELFVGPALCLLVSALVARRERAHLLHPRQGGRRDPGAQHERAVALGLPPAAAERLSAEVHQVHRLEGQGDRRVQDRRPERPGQAVGHPEEPPLDELRQDEPRPPLLLPGQHPQEGPGRATLLPVSPITLSKHFTNLILSIFFGRRNLICIL